MLMILLLLVVSFDAIAQLVNAVIDIGFPGFSTLPSDTISTLALDSSMSPDALS